MRLRRISAVVRRHVYEAMRNPDRIADTLLWPFLDVVTWGFFSRYLVHGGAASFAKPAQLIGGIALWGAFRAFQRDMAVGFLGDIWSRNISGLFVSPLSPGEYLVGLTVVNLAKLSLGLGLITLACYLLTGVPAPVLAMQLLAPLAVLLVFGAALGLLVTALILRYSTRVQTLAYGVAGLLMPLSCVFYPLSALPVQLRGAAALLPATQAFEAMRQCMRGMGLPAGTLVRGGCGALLILIAALIFFQCMLHGIRRSGRLLRMD
jgi:ABC-2 type transport system permease protein